MKIEYLIVGIGLLFVAYGIGYSVGMRHCFYYLRDELDKFRDEIEDEIER